MLAGTTQDIEFPYAMGAGKAITSSPTRESLRVMTYFLPHVEDTATVTVASVVPTTNNNVDPWIARAREHANNIWQSYLADNKRPAKERIAPEISRRLYRDDEMVTKRNTRITAEYIVSHALSPTRNGGWKPPAPE